MCTANIVTRSLTVMPLFIICLSHSIGAAQVPMAPANHAQRPELNSNTIAKYEHQSNETAGIQIRNRETKQNGKSLDFMPILTVVVGFLLSGVIGNYLLQKWQRGSQHAQQHFSGKESEYSAFKNTVSNILRMSSERLYSMKRLYNLISSDSNKEEIEKELEEYRSILREWNSNLNVFFVELTIYDCRETSVYLEGALQEPFHSVGRKLDAVIRRWQCGERIHVESEIAHGLDILSARIYKTNMKLLSRVEKLRNLLYFGEKIYFTKYQLDKFTTWELFEALFIRKINAHSVRRSITDTGVPGRRRI